MSLEHTLHDKKTGKIRLTPVQSAIDFMRQARTSFPSELINVVGECRMKVGGKGSLDNSCELQATAAIKPQKY